MSNLKINKIINLIKVLFLLIILNFYACNQNSISEDSIHIKFPLYIDMNKIPSGWNLDDHYGYALQNSNVKNIYINDIVIEGNFDLTVYTNEPLKTYKNNYDFKGIHINATQNIAADILDTLLNQNIALYEVPRVNIIEWIDLENQVKYFYSSKDSFFLISYLIPYTADPENRRNRLRERLKER